MEDMSLIKIAEVGFLFWMVVPCILFAIRVIYQLDGIFVYFSSTCFGLTRPSSGVIEFIISFTNAAYGVLGAARCRS